MAHATHRLVLLIASSPLSKWHRYRVLFLAALSYVTQPSLQARPCKSTSLHARVAAWPLRKSI